MMKYEVLYFVVFAYRSPSSSDPVYANATGEGKHFVWLQKSQDQNKSTQPGCFFLFFLNV